MQPVREIGGDRERQGELSSYSLTHSCCSGYSTELRGMKLMYDSSRTITVLQTRISLIICVTENGTLSIKLHEQELNFH